MNASAESVHSLLQASLATAPAERQAALIAIAEGIGQGIKPNDK